ncbi:RraA family protein [Aminobacter ciceronei]|uniref:Putative 4-hydroxy-4-methyl-2-oxoglutarate aldolase n=1 Tax=Aminobacter ciceronei TaxID=150723 RepID=A0ABR6CGT1_9HYPH|nr:RraA family protein [Aminobacter ciceronei]MBA8909842.1 regulator of RNase E activity RraA [Aminobacter ciceronei]MBA9023562.1 regulator of RNase E activity RraA [Aminobacter ciceronei]
MTVTELPSAAPVADDLLRQYANVATSIVSDNLDRLPGAVGLLPFHAGGQLLGTALTVRTRRGDNLAIHAALRIARPGDVIVVDGGGDTSQALIGEIILAHAESLGVAGFVIDGAIRDVAAIKASKLPCFARGVTHRGPYKNGPGAINVDVAIGGLVVHPGDLVVGDEDGVVALSPKVAADILPGIRAQEEKERLKLEGFRTGARLRAV